MSSSSSPDGTAGSSKLPLVSPSYVAAHSPFQTRRRQVQTHQRGSAGCALARRVPGRARRQSEEAQSWKEAVIPPALPLRIPAAMVH